MGGVIVVSVLFILCCIFHKNVLWIGQTLMAFPFYYVGFLCKEKIEGLIINNNPILGILLCLFLTIGLTLLNGRVSMLGVTFGGNTLGPFKVIVFYLNGFIGSLLLLYLGSLVKHRLVWIEQLSSSLLSVLGLQMFFTQTWKFTIGWNQSWFLSVSVSFLILLVCCMMHSILVKFLPIFFGKK